MLAGFTAKLGDDGKKVTDITAPDNAIPERLSLLSTATLQALLLGWTAQQLIDPECAPTGAQLEAALRELSA